MNYLITYPSAFEYWMHQSHFPDFRISKNLISQNEGTDFDFDRERLLRAAEKLQLSLPLHVEKSSGGRIRNTKEIIFHEKRKHVPEESYYKLSEGVYICSPELCFLQAAATCSLEELVNVANDLCSAYYLTDYSTFGQNKRTPLTSISKIRFYLNRAKGAYGVHRAFKAIKYALDNSFSPYESKIAAICSLPICLGGFGISGGQLNCEINLSSKSAKLLGRKQCHCDMVWKQKKVVLEYDSNLVHLDKEQFNYDKKRVTALTASGYKVVTGTTNQINNFSQINDLFFLLRRTLGYKNCEGQFEKNFEKRYQVFKQLFRK